MWEIQSGSGWSHPVHVHFEEGIVLKRNGLPPPEWEKWARKDVYRIGGGEENSGTIEFAIHFREFAGSYMEGIAVADVIRQAMVIAGSEL